jgi:hypothetical protein
VGELGQYLNDPSKHGTDGAIAQMVIAEHKTFEGYAGFARAQITSRFPIGYVLDRLDGDDIDKDRLKEHWEAFDKRYWALVEAALPQEKQNEELQKLAAQAVKCAAQPGMDLFEKMRELMALLCGLCTLPFPRACGRPSCTCGLESAPAV